MAAPTHTHTHTRVTWIQISGYHLTIFIISINYPLRLKRCLPLHLRKGFSSATISTPFSVKGCRVKCFPLQQRSGEARKVWSVEKQAQQHNKRAPLYQKKNTEAPVCSRLKRGKLFYAPSPPSHWLQTVSFSFPLVYRPGWVQRKWATA